MTVPGNIDALLLGGQRGYQIERSLRFNNPTDTVSLTRTPASAGNRRTWTWSAWVKRAGEMNGSTSGDYYQMLFTGNTAGSTDATFTAIFLYNNTLRVGGYATNWRISNALFRDPSAWYHFVVAVDTTDATANNIVRAYVNGTEITWATINNPTQNADWGINQAAAHSLGGAVSGSGQGLAGYLTEVNFIDGQALTPSSFGETDTITGVWKPKKYSGSGYGTNGFYLNFADNSGTTSTTLGKDSSPNGNNWTPNNFSVTAGAGNDSMIDTPTPYADGGNGRGNYCTWNPLSIVSPSTLSNGNLDVSTGAAGGGYTYGTFAIPTSGKWYWEIKPTSNVGSSFCRIGLGNITLSKLVTYYNNGNKSIDGADTAYGASYTDNDIIGVAYNSDSGTITFYKNNSTQGNISYSLGSETLFPMIHDGSGSAGITAEANFGQRSFSYTPPSGFLALNTQNLPEPSIKKPSSYMDVVLWTGNGAAGRSITGLNFSPDLVWLKNRPDTYHHQLHDAVRGASAGALYSGLTNAQDPNFPLTSFDSSGFTLGNTASLAAQSQGSQNYNGQGFVAWCWDESATPGFDIVTYTGTGSNTDINHNLGVTPSFAIIKQRNTAQSWWVWHTALGNNVNANNTMLELNGTAGTYAADDVFRGFTSSVFKVGTDSGSNTNGGTYVAYLWSEVASFSKFGNYVGNGSSDGPFVFTGMRSRFIMVKRTDVANNWQIWDTARSTYNAATKYLLPNLSDNEYDFGTTDAVDVTANGFKFRASNNAVNASGGTYIFAAFAESPFKYSLAR